MKDEVHGLKDEVHGLKDGTAAIKADVKKLIQLFSINFFVELPNLYAQAPTIAFNFRDDQGQWIGKSYFEQLATQNGIQLRTGGVCNPGGIAFYLAMSPGQMREYYAEGLRCGNGIDEMNGKPTGIIRVSLGSMSNSTDVQTFMKFLRTFVEQETSRSPISKSQDNSVKSDWLERDVAAPMKQPSEKGVGIDDPIATARKPTLDKMLHTLRRFTCH
ncbi:MAG: hypothetical protein LQ341_001788 [Variospora aurantia]|nr:MAG: hypothetical protein LQ341_001788 [Variospora aurantia]